MNTNRNPLGDRAYELLRIVAGALFTFHGVQKIFGVLTDHQQEVGSQRWIGGLIELVCGAAIALGFMTRPAAFLACGTMAVAYIQFHWKLRFDSGFFPVVNGGEPAVLYCFIFLLVMFRGTGLWSIDALRRTRR
jgi:putative oxidoreductase